MTKNEFEHQFKCQIKDHGHLMTLYKNQQALAYYDKFSHNFTVNADYLLHQPIFIEFQKLVEHI